MYLVCKNCNKKNHISTFERKGNILVCPGCKGKN